MLQEVFYALIKVYLGACQDEDRKSHMETIF